MNIINLLTNRVYQFSSKKAFFILLPTLIVILVIMQGGTNGMKAIDSSADMLDMRHFGYSETVVYDLLTNLGQAGRQIYIRQLGIDYIFAVVYALFQSVMITGLMKRSGASLSIRPLNLLPYLRSALDMIENCLLLPIILQFPVKLPALVAVASTFTLLKWFVYALVMLTLISLGVYMSTKSMAAKRSLAKAGKSL